MKFAFLQDKILCILMMNYGLFKKVKFTKKKLAVFIGALKYYF